MIVKGKRLRKKEVIKTIGKFLSKFLKEIKSESSIVSNNKKIDKHKNIYEKSLRKIFKKSKSEIEKDKNRILI